MGVNYQRGFTIIEISLFFAVSSLLLFTLMVGITIAVQRQRFTDSVNSAQSFLQQQYNETQTTINNRSSLACGDAVSRGTSDCLVIGKIIDLLPANNNSDDNRFNSYNVTADATLPSNANALDNVTLLNQLHPTAVREQTNDQEYIVAWGAQIRLLRDSEGDGNNDTSAGSAVRYLLILRSPTSGLMQTYELNSMNDIFSANDTEDLSGRISLLGGSSERAIKACVTSADLIGVNALLTIEESGTQDGVTTAFDTDEAREWCT